MGGLKILSCTNFRRAVQFFNSVIGARVKSACDNKPISVINNCLMMHSLVFIMCSATSSFERAHTHLYIEQPLSA